MINKPQLRPYQSALKTLVKADWANEIKNVLAVLPTGAGKTVFFSDIINEEPGATCAIAHRQELVSQISVALARNGVFHRIIGPQKVVKLCVRLHMEEVGQSFYDPSSKHAVAGVDTLVRRGEQLKSWLPTVRLWVMDEAHHVLRDNKWGKAVSMFPNARGLGVTATPTRADGNGLGAHADGVFQTMHVGTTMRNLITQGFLTEYKLFAPKSDFSRDDIKVTASGEFSVSESSKAVATSSLVAHAEKGQIIGDAVRTYQKLINGLLTIVFAPDVSTGYQLEAEYNAAGIPAKCVHGAMADEERLASVKRFRKGELLVLINVALFDEGFDLPAIQAVQDVSATESFGRFVQRAGRMLRLLKGKEFGIYVDHVGNIARHAKVVHYQDCSRVEISHREWTLDRGERRSKSEPSETRTCLGCTATFPRFMVVCPYCQEPTPVPKMGEGSSIEVVDGDLYELTAEVLAQLQGAVARVDMSPQDYRDQLARQGVPQIGIMAHVKRHVTRQETISVLRDTMAQWGGWERARGLSDKEIFRKFYLTYGVDWLTAQASKTDGALSLTEKLNKDMPK